MNTLAGEEISSNLGTSLGTCYAGSPLPKDCDWFDLSESLGEGDGDEQSGHSPGCCGVT